MLDTETKRRIDSCRDILVGKVPDPKSQVEQITIALIYKFMDDMDAEAEELGGKRSFFAGEYGQYGWARLKAPELSGKEKLDLYGEAIGRMNENPGIPPLFRDIFKNAYLPYRDPETLRAFLKEIDGFTYDHSERLGDAFEYLLSVLGSQGDAGQFRTPRHIIDFMVAVVDPQKHESILDPACGTAGFLISAWKHILKHNTSPRPPGEGPGVRAGDQLTPAERASLAANIRGYDISPDMVRLSLVNLYLHGFTDPHIVEYDTLTSDERWNETADVILANPPFMSPKGGIKPHKRFSVQATRSEVLFVDYMAEHLSAQGRAAIIVPEGIIFQSGTAYRKLREMLVKTSLVAVVSLPAGVFNPYAGVKTSILFLDKRLAKKCDSVLFVKVDNDGFGLGAQRRAVSGSGLPDALAAFQSYRHSREGGNLTNGNAGPEVFSAAQFPGAHVVGKARIGENGEWNLSGDRYLVASEMAASNWPVFALGELCSFMTGGTPSSTAREYYENGSVPWLVSGDIHKKRIFDCVNHITKEAVANSNAKILPENSVLIALNGQGKTRGTVALLRMKNATCNQSLVSINPVRSKLLPGYLFCVLDSMYQTIRDITGDNQRSGLNIPIIKTIRIPLPPLAIQQEIVAEIEGYQKIIDGARQVVENYRPRIVVQPDWPIFLLGDVCNAILTGPFGSALHQSDYVANGIPIVNPKNIIDGSIVKNDAKTVSEATQARLKEFSLRENDIVIGRRGEMGRCAIVTGDMNGWLCGTGCFVIRIKNNCDPRFVFLHLTSSEVKARLEQQAVGVTMMNLNQGILSAIEIPIPFLETQRSIVAEVEAEQALVNASKQLIARFEAKIKTTINRVWGGSE